jgi:hypothetical protein
VTFGVTATGPGSVGHNPALAGTDRTNTPAKNATAPNRCRSRPTKNCAVHFDYNLPLANCPENSRAPNQKRLHQKVDIDSSWRTPFFCLRGEFGDNFGGKLEQNASRGGWSKPWAEPGTRGFGPVTFCQGR